MKEIKGMEEVCCLGGVALSSGHSQGMAAGGVCVGGWGLRNGWVHWCE